MIRALAVAFILAAALALPGEAQNGAGLIRIFSVTKGVRTVDVGQPGPSAGDERLAGLVLRDRRNRVIGTGYRLCTSLDSVLGRQASLCEVVLHMPRGKLVALGTRVRRDYYVLPVIGGTGLYSSSQGTLLASTTEVGPPRVERLLISLVT